MKVTFKLLIVYFFALLLMTAVSSYLTVSRIYESYEISHRALLDSVADELERDLEQAFALQGPSGPLRVLERRRDEIDALLGGPDVAAPEPFPSEVRLKYASSVPRVLRAVWIDDEGHRILTVYRPVVHGPEAIGALELTGSIDALDEEARRTILQNLALLGAAAAFGLTMAYAAGVRWIARPLETLIDKTRRIGQGDLGGPVVIRTRDELHELGRSMNEMCDRIAAQQDAIRRETAEKLAATDQLRHADRLKTVGRLAAGIAHELGTPLNVVTGRAGMIASGNLPPEAMQSNAVIIKQESERIAQIVRGLLDFARRKPTQRTEFDLTDLVARTTTLLEPLAQKAEVAIEALPEGAAPVTDDGRAQVLGDPAQIQQALTNLVMNAVQASRPRSTVRVRLEERTFDPAALPAAGLRVGTVPEPGTPAADYVTIVVEDDGSGIAPENLAHLVEPFFTTKDVGEGTGLGLSIVYGIVQDHGGWLEADSTPGVGSTFRIVLPQESGE
ncbi:MAG TPA: ATP-binding protein [Pirellulaceae bacterium]|jgi:signal transduction histidine kinase|nr:ATP-binding protein [Pirellulaceae bacterium]